MDTRSFMFSTLGFIIALMGFLFNLIVVGSTGWVIAFAMLMVLNGANALYHFNNG